MTQRTAFACCATLPAHFLWRILAEKATADPSQRSTQGSAKRGNVWIHDFVLLLGSNPMTCPASAGHRGPAQSALGPCHHGRARAWAVINGRPRFRGTAGSLA